MLHYYFYFVFLVIICAIWILQGNEFEQIKFSRTDRKFVVKNRIEENIKRHMKETKISKLHTLYLQAGFKFSLFNHVVISLISMFLLGVLSYVFFKNEIISLAVFAYGFTLPSQILTTIKNHRAEKLEDQIISFMQMNNARYRVAGTIPDAFMQCREDLSKVQPIGKILEDCCYMFNAGVSEEEVLRIFAIKCNSRFAEIYVNFLINSRDINSYDAKQQLLKKSETKAIRQRDLKRLQRNKLRSNKKACYILMATVPFFAALQAFTNRDYINFMTNTTAGKVGTATVFVIMAVSLFIINKKLSVFSE